MCVNFSLGFLFCSIDLYVCLCASTNTRYYQAVSSKHFSFFQYLIAIIFLLFKFLSWLVCKACEVFKLPPGRLNITLKYIKKLNQPTTDNFQSEHMRVTRISEYVCIKFRYPLLDDRWELEPVIP